MKKIISILIGLSLLLSLSVIAAPASADSGVSFVEVSLGTKGAATAEWSTAQEFSGDYSVHLKTTGTPGTGDEARVVFPVPAGTTLGDINSIAWWEYLVKGYPPHVDIILDVSGITGTPGATDALVFEYAYNTQTHAGEGQITPPTCYGALNGSWYQTFSDDGNGPAVIDGTANAWISSGNPGPLPGVQGVAYAAVTGQFVYDTLSDWKAGLAVNEIGASTPVLRLEIEVDNWIAQSEAYVDLLSINPIYDLEPTVGPNCACATAEYTILFITTASLTEGFNSVCVEFPDGTTVPDTFEDGDITINGMDVFGLEVTVDGTTVCFLVPEDVDPGVITQVTFTADAGIKNPCEDGDYTLFVWTDRAPDATPVESEEYTIVPAVSDYVWLLDFGPTYPGIAPEFVPPFKACGQEDFGVHNASIDGYLEAFNLTLMADPVGCDTPCDEAELYMTLMAAPAGANVTLNISDVWYTLTEDDIGEEITLDDALTLETDLVQVYPSQVHFSTKGDYQICFYVECPEVTGCDPEAEEIILERCVDFKVYQWKDAEKITLREKWNLISLPLVPLVDPPVEDTLASIPAADRALIQSIWYYDRCADEWFVWGNGQDSLTELVDGEAYWVRVDYPLDGCGNITWWVWGTEKPMPPASPAEYAVCDGWNMVGFLGTSSADPDDYLWNWAGNMPVIYGWTQDCWTLQGWDLISGADTLDPGQGYWMAFNGDGDVYVP